MTVTPKKRSRKQSVEPPSSRPRALLILVALVACAVRAIAAVQIGRLPISRTPQFDALEYLIWAQRIAGGDFAWPPYPPHGPAYPLVLAAALFAGGGNLWFARMVQAALGAATCILAGLTAQRLFGPRAGVLTAALLAVYAPLVWLDVSIASEGLLMFLLAFALWSAVTERSPLLTGALIGLAALTRPTSLLFAPLLLWIGARSTRQRVTLLAAAALVILPVSIANWRASHAFIPIQAFGGINVYLGNSPMRDGTASARPGGEWESLEAEAARGGASTLAAEDSYFVSKTLREIGAHPAAFARLLLRKVLLTFQNEEVRDTHSFSFFRELAPILRWLPGFGILFAFAAAGAALSDWSERGVRIIATWTALATLTCVVLVVGSRYRIPLALGLALFAGAIAARAVSRRRIGVAVVAGVLAAACSQIVTTRVQLGEEWALTADSLFRENRLSEGEAAARQAIEIEPSNALGWDALGSIFAASGRTADAADAFHRALTLSPQFAGAHQHLAMLLADGGDVAAAASEYRQVIAVDPRNAPALLALARLDGALGKASEGLDAALRAARIKRPDDDDWIIIAMLAADSHRFDIAEDALAHVSESSPRVQQVRETIRRGR